MWGQRVLIRGVTFDLWQTLLIDNRDLGLARMKVRLDGALEALRGAGEEYSEEQVAQAYRQCYRTCHDVRAQELDVSFMEQIEIFIRHIDEGLPERLPQEVVGRIAEVYADSLFDYPPPPHPDAKGVLSRLKEAGYFLGLISNTGMTPGVTLRTYMEQVGILEYFDVLAFSDELKLAKPASRIFLHTTDGLRLPPGQVVHVGDHLLNDVFGAGQVEMKTIWIDTKDDHQQKVDVRPDATVRSLGEAGGVVESLATASS